MRISLMLACILVLHSGCGVSDEFGVARYFGGGNDIAVPQVPTENNQVKLRSSPLLFPLAKASPPAKNAWGMAYEHDAASPLAAVKFAVDNSGNLSNKLFAAFSDGEHQAYSESGEYDFDPSTLAFLEVSLFANLTKLVDWYRELGIEPLDEYLIIELSTSSENIINNALYIPVGYGNAQEKIDYPTILIGKGDGLTLQNLAIDADVIAHEFAHHLIFQRIRHINEQSLMLHEGIADSLAMLYSDDPHLGNTICVPGSKACGQAEYLRTADNDYRLYDLRNHPTHLKSQVISGLVWDLKKNSDLPPQMVARLLIRAIEYLGDSSEIDDFVVALQYAQQELAGDAYGAIIKDAARQRGLIR